MEKEINKQEYLTVSIHMKIDGELIKMKEVNYQRGRETETFTLDDFARIVFMWEHMFDGGSTYAMDGFIQKAEKKLPKKDGETAQSVFLKYWVNIQKTINDEFERSNKGDKESEFPIFPEENDYLTFEIFNRCRGFNNSAIPVQYGFLYWFYKYIMNGSIKEIEEEIKNVPDYIRQIVDTKIVKDNSDERK